MGVVRGFGGFAARGSLRSHLTMTGSGRATHDAPHAEVPTRSGDLEARTRLMQSTTLLYRANTKSPFAGMTISADVGKPCIGSPPANTPPPLPATIGFTQLS